MTDLRDAVIVLTGASGGFGQQFIRQTLMQGSQLILTDIDLPRLEAAADAICNTLGSQGQGKILQCVAADLSTPEGCDTLYAAVEHGRHKTDILINNAGIGMFGRFDETPEDKWEGLMQTNLIAPMRLIHRFVPDMIARRKGHIVNLSSLAGWVGTSGLATYSASKYGLRGFGEALMEELAPYNIHVTNVYPFFSKTPILNSPNYGTQVAPPLPDSVTTDPADVIRQVIQGIQKNKQHVFPDRTAKTVHWLKRLAPGILPRLMRR